MKNQTNIVIIGASSAGLSVAAYFQKHNIPYVLLEQSDVVASQWRNHYERLHLHTPKSISNLPFYKMPSSYEKYPSREKVVAYFDEYVQKLNIQPKFNTKVDKIERQDGDWLIKTTKGDYIAKHVVVATGNTRYPKKIQKKGLETFTGTTIHSSEYKNGSPYKNKNVLVVGFGNSACEIAICLTEHGAKASLSVRSEVNVLPRDIFGMSTMKMGMTTNFLPPRIADKLNAPLVNLLVGDITKLGLKKSKYGPKELVAKTGRVALLDIGTVDLIKKGKIKVYGDIVAIDKNTIEFKENKKDKFDAIIFATGFENGLTDLVEGLSEERLLDAKKKISKRDFLGKGNIYFAGYHVSLDGMLRECGVEAKYIFKHIKNELNKK